ncbi:MAG: hypothetical protein K6U74_02780, partial [Firmicutes bacterium]|nr:hypothetical protein [Bacillota bacterium]
SGKALCTVLPSFNVTTRKYFPWDSPDLKGYSHDAGKAGDLLENAGWKDVDGDGVRENKGNKLELVLETYGDRPELPVIAQVVQSQLGAVGIRVKIETKEYGAVEKSLTGKGYDMVLMARGLAFTPDPSVALDDFKSDSKSTWRPNYTNPRDEEQPVEEAVDREICIDFFVEEKQI